MKNTLKLFGLAGTLCVSLVAVSGGARAEHLGDQIDRALSTKNLKDVQSLLAQSPANVDEVLKKLLQTTQKTLTSDPAFSGNMLTLAGQYAAKISPPTVPSICADLRRIMEELPPSTAPKDLYKTAVLTAQSFSNAPVVVAQGRPNLCEDAWLRGAEQSGDEALLAQLPSMHTPGLPVTTIGLPKPPGTNPPEEKPSAD